MQNKKTTILGILTLVGALIGCVTEFLSGGNLGDAINNLLIPAIAGLGGLGLIAASDGGV